MINQHFNDSLIIVILGNFIIMNTMIINQHGVYLFLREEVN